MLTQTTTLYLCFLPILITFVRGQSTICIWRSTDQYGDHDRYNGEYTKQSTTHNSKAWWQQTVSNPNCATSQTAKIFASLRNSTDLYWQIYTNLSADYLWNVPYCSVSSLPSNPSQCASNDWRIYTDTSIAPIPLTLTPSCPTLSCDRIQIIASGNSLCNHIFTKDLTQHYMYTLDTGSSIRYLYFNIYTFKWYCSDTDGHMDCVDDSLITHQIWSSSSDEWKSASIGESFTISVTTGNTATLKCLDIPIPTKHPTPAPTLYPTDAPTPAPTSNPTPAPTFHPTNSPTRYTTGDPTPEPTESPTPYPTESPTPAPTSSPTPAPTDAPTPAPTDAPTFSPTNSPTYSPTHNPTSIPTHSPTQAPTSLPTMNPTHAPSNAPTHAPSNAPTITPTFSPTQAPTAIPTHNPTLAPTKTPTYSPTNAPTTPPTNAPSLTPTNAPSLAPTNVPSLTPTLPPTLSPTNAPSLAPTNVPSLAPSNSPSLLPTNVPSNAPSISPTIPTDSPSLTPTNAPSLAPTSAPTITWYMCSLNVNCKYITEMIIGITWSANDDFVDLLSTRHWLKYTIRDLMLTEFEQHVNVNIENMLIAVTISTITSADVQVHIGTDDTEVINALFGVIDGSNDMARDMEITLTDTVEGKYGNSSFEVDNVSIEISSFTSYESAAVRINDENVDQNTTPYVIYIIFSCVASLMISFLIVLCFCVYRKRTISRTQMRKLTENIWMPGDNVFTGAMAPNINILNISYQASSEEDSEKESNSLKSNTAFEIINELDEDDLDI